MTEQHTKPAEMSPCDLIPLALLGLELAEHVDMLAARLGSEVELDDVGMRCVARDLARRVIAEKREEDERVRAHRRRQQEQTTALLAEAQAVVSRGVPAPEGFENLSAAQVMTAGAAAQRLAAAGERWEEYASGDITFHPITGGEE